MKMTNEAREIAHMIPNPQIRVQALEEIITLEGEAGD